MWSCLGCQGEREDVELYCAECLRPRYTSYALMLAEHISEHLEDGLTDAVAVLQAMQSRPVYARFGGLTLALIAQQMRLLTTDTTALARQIAKARAARTMLEVIETGDAKDKIAVMKGIGVLSDKLDISGQIAMPVRVEHVYLSSSGGYLTIPERQPS